MRLGVPSLKRAILALAVLLGLSLALVCCGGGSPTSTSTSGLKFRVFVSQDVQASVGVVTVSPALIIINALTDAQTTFRIGGGLGGAFRPTMMVLSNNRQTTLAVSYSGTQVEVVNNTAESVTTGSPINLPGATESVVISPDATLGFAAVPAAPISEGTQGQVPPGAVVVMNLSNQSVTASVPVPGAQYVAESGDGSKILVLSNNSNYLDTVTIMSPFNIVSGQENSTCPANVCTTVSGFDRPVYAFFSSDNSQAWILNCGAECGGQQASVQVLDLATRTAGAKVTVDAATVGFIQNQTMYVAGTPPAPGNSCTGVTTAAPTCGRLNVVDLPSMTVTNRLVIADGYHTHMDMGGGQLFIGSKQCFNILPPTPPATGEQRGCLTIVDTLPSPVTQVDVVFPPDNGDVTGMTPITNRTVFYVVEGGELRIYDTNTDKIYVSTSIDIFGNAVDVKQVDF